ncbi:DNA polymerase III subunit gamma and tau [Jiangella muralis]|uniref:DNA polymerase III subunit gamma and tau n=1 Tax=Jiangella muralis TaxID=702383 RepID=UPI00069D084A|nr:DNA polymerase III subunit gamma and tau [Jiangella muralis]
MSSLALYRTYRPGRFADVVGQEHVTVPLMRALANDRVHHAYLFSGPRGCGKTSSARILARSLNCEKGPTDEPCGQCQSCLDLAPNGSGNIDVVELDAATHGLVDDARDLREKAHFAPVSSQFKIYIIDEAHQLGPGAANALLKLIEEPPAHLKFIFATTAPDKIIGTIRSRTHHYPFRLIPTKTLQQNLGWICEQEGVPIEPAALALVARAGAGSARDAQSILGQLIAGAGDDGVTYDLAVALLGFTDAAMLDQVVEAVSAGDGRSVYAAVDQVMDAGHDPRRFLTDLLERFRDLIVLRAAPDAVAEGLLDLPPEQAERMAIQASQFGPSDLVRLAAVVDEGITAMKGATPTRLQLELVCARLLLPGADDTVSGIQARLDRVERRLTGAEPLPPAEAAPAPAPAPVAEAAPGASQRAAAFARVGPPAEASTTPAVAPPAAAEPRTTPPAATESSAAPPAPAGPESSAPVAPPVEPTPSTPPAEPPADLARPAPDPEPAAVEQAAVPEQPTAPPAGQSPPAQAPPAAPPAPSTPATPAAPSAQAAPPAQTAPAEPATGAQPIPSAGASGATGGVADLRRMWPEVLVRLKEIKRTPWSLISQESVVSDVSDGVLTLAFRQPTLRDTFARRADFQESLQQAIKDVLLLDLRVEAIVDPSADPSAQNRAAPAAPSARSAPAPRPTQPGPPAAAEPQAPPPATDDPGPSDPGPGDPGPGDPGPGRAAAAKAAARRVQGQAGAPAAAGAAAPSHRTATDDDADPDDEDLADDGVSERELLERTLGATVIAEIEHE